MFFEGGENGRGAFAAIGSARSTNTQHNNNEHPPESRNNKYIYQKWAEEAEADQKYNRKRAAPGTGVLHFATIAMVQMQQMTTPLSGGGLVVRSGKTASGK